MGSLVFEPATVCHGRATVPVPKILKPRCPDSPPPSFPREAGVVRAGTGVTSAGAGAAPAIVVTGGFDPLVDEGDAYAARLAAAGVAVRHRRHPSLVHGFLSLAGGVRAARKAIDQLCSDITELL